jgi:transposase
LEQLHDRRKQVVRLHLRGTAVMEIAALTGLSYRTVRNAIDLFVAGDWSAIKPAARGRSAGDGRLLSAQQEASVRRTFCDKRPERLKMEFALWTRGAVMQFVEREFGVRLSIRATGEYLRRWGFTPQKPIKRAYEQRPEAVKQWLDLQYPAIERRAKARGRRDPLGRRDRAGQHRRARAQLCAARQDPSDHGCGRHAREAVDDLHRDQPRARQLDDHRRGVQP